MRDFRPIATVSSVRFQTEGLVVRCMAGLFGVLSEGLEIHLVPPRIDAVRKGRITSVRYLDERDAIISLDSISDSSEASALVGMQILVDAALVEEGVLPVERDLESYEVVDASLGRLGVVRGILEGPYQDLLEVERNGVADYSEDKGPSLLIPFVDAFIIFIDDDARRIDVSVPPGLLEL